MRKYETIFVIDSLLKSDEIDNIVNKYERFISANGGKIDDIEHWGKKRLAYEIKKRQYGYYVLIRFEGPSTMIKPLEREYRLNESLLRFKTLLMEKASLEAAEKAAQLKKAAAEEKLAEEKPPENKVAAEEPVAASEENAPAEEPETEESATEESGAAAVPVIEEEAQDNKDDEDDAKKE